MKALFLADRTGPRLQLLTNALPTSMIPIMNKPLIERTMARLKRIGITEIVISTCLGSEYLKKYFGDGEQFGVKIAYITADSPLSMGETIRNAESLFDDAFIVFHSDIVSDIDIQKMIEYHQSKKAQATIAVVRMEGAPSGGVIESDSNGYAASFIEKPKSGMIISNHVSAGIYIFEPVLLKKYFLNNMATIEEETFSMLLAKGYTIGVFKSNQYWMNIGTIEKYKQVHMDMLNQRCCLGEYNAGNTMIVLCKNVNIHPTAKIIGPAYIGDNVKIGEKAIVSNSVLGSNTFIGAGNRIIGSILWNDVKTNKNVRIFNSVISSNKFINENMNCSNNISTEEYYQKYFMDKIVQ